MKEYEEKRLCILDLLSPLSAENLINNYIGTTLLNELTQFREINSARFFLHQRDSFDEGYDSICQSPEENKMQIALSQLNIKSLRENQRQVIECIFSKKDCLVLMPTGGGKSLCYHLPAMLENGVTIVICPLISLMIDQVTNLKSKNV